MTTPVPTFAILTNTQAPVYQAQSMHIQATPQKVWEILSNIPQWPAWLSTVSKAQLNGPMQPGTTFDWKTSSGTIHSTLHTVSPSSHLGWTGKILGIAAVHNWTLREANGGTEVTVSESMEGFLVRLFKRMFTGILQKDMAQSLQLLKQACE